MKAPHGNNTQPFPCDSASLSAPRHCVQQQHVKFYDTVNVALMSHDWHQEIISSAKPI